MPNQNLSDQEPLMAEPAFRSQQSEPLAEHPRDKGEGNDSQELATQRIIQDWAVVGDRLIEIVDELLATGNWDGSLFLQTQARKLKELQRQAKLFLDKEDSDESLDVAHQNPEISEEQQLVKLYIPLYQMAGRDLSAWEGIIKTLTSHPLTRPVYGAEEHAREFVRTRSAAIECNGYVGIMVKKSDFWPLDNQLDSLGHQLLALRNNSLAKGWVVDFVHANRDYYQVKNDKLILNSQLDQRG